MDLYRVNGMVLISLIKKRISMKSTILKIIILGLMPALALGSRTGLGGVAQNLMEPVTFFSDFIQSGCFLIGGSFVFASIIKYFEHRRSPLMVPISTVVFLLIAGIILILLPFLSLVMAHGVPYTFLPK
jgi:hypothetical protein